jgi:hypothetical protein
MQAAIRYNIFGKHSFRVARQHEQAPRTESRTSEGGARRRNREIGNRTTKDNKKATAQVGEMQEEIGGGVNGNGVCNAM